MRSSVAGLIYSTPSHHYDHIASLCVFLEVPLIVTEEHVQESLQKIYPTLVILCFDYLSLGNEVVSRFSVILSCHPRPHLERILSFSEDLLQKKCTTIFIPHGNSDKGHLSGLMEGFAYEKLVGVYGKKMLDFFSEKKVSDHLFGTIHLGNYREQVYTKLKPHFHNLLKEQAVITKTKQTIFFAPTWDDDEHSCSLFSVIDSLLAQKPDDVTLIVKPHPNTFQTDLPRLEQLQGKIDAIENVFLIRDFPPIYALLDLSDVYLGDMSSIGYDFLTYNRPMFFLNPNKRDPKTDRGLQLLRCGEVIYPENFDALYEVMEHPQTELKKPRHDMYHYTFGEPVSSQKMKKQLLDLVSAFTQ